MAVTAEVNVSSITRIIELKVTPDEAQRGRDYLRAAVERDIDEPYVIAIMRGALDAVANNREHGGH